MGFFDWAAPLVRLYGDRFTAEDATVIAGWLSPTVQPGGRILDVGGGAGQLAALLSNALDAHVTVLDPTAKMLEHVPTGERITAISGSAEAIPFEDSAYDAIVVTDAFHHFSDQAAAAAEFARVARPGGAVLVLDLDPRPLGMRLVVLAERLVGEPSSFMTPEQMCAFMAENGIRGECAPEKGVSYRFLGTVEKERPAA